MSLRYYVDCVKRPSGGCGKRYVRPEGVLKSSCPHCGAPHWHKKMTVPGLDKSLRYAHLRYVPCKEEYGGCGSIYRRPLEAPQSECPNCGRVTKHQGKFSREPTVAEAAWLAGLVEGRARLWWHRNTNGRTRPACSLRVPGDHLHRDAFERCRTIMDGKGTIVASQVRVRVVQKWGRSNNPLLKYTIEGYPSIRRLQEITLPYLSDTGRGMFERLWARAVGDSNNDSDSDE